MELFRYLESYLAALQLIFAMLGMGATLHVRDFYEIGQRPVPIALVLFAQYVVFSLSAVVLADWLNLPPGVALGLLLLAVMPSGALSNIFAHLGRGNLALSITATVASTTVCLLVTPLLLRWLGTTSLPDNFQMPTGQIVFDVFCYLLVPVLLGMLLLRWKPELAPPFAKWMVRLSMVVLAAIVVGSLGTGRIDVWHYGWSVPVVLTLFCLFQFVVTRLVTMGLKYSADDSYTMAIEVAVRNGNLAILLGSRMFPSSGEASETLGAGALYVALFYGGASLVVAIISVALRRRRYRRVWSEAEASA